VDADLKLQVAFSTPATLSHFQRRCHRSVWRREVAITASPIVFTTAPLSACHNFIQDPKWALTKS